MMEIESRVPVPDGVVPLLDECGKQIGTAAVIGDRITATITDDQVAERLRSLPTGYSLGYTLAIKAIPAASKERA